MFPGTSVSCGSVKDTPVFGMPGQAIASLITFFNLVFPMLKSWGVPIPAKKHVIGEITEDINPCNQFDIFHLVSTPVWRQTESFIFPDGVTGLEKVKESRLYLSGNLDFSVSMRDLPLYAPGAY